MPGAAAKQLLEVLLLLLLLLPLMLCDTLQLRMLTVLPPLRHCRRQEVRAAAANVGGAAGACRLA
jgi:hypothetical protein